MRDLNDIAAPGTRERALLERIDPARLPRHIAIIMDGNGRWAKARHLPRVEGHRAGIRAVRESVEIVAALEVEVLTLYAFSTENWKRPRHEVVTLMGLLKEYLRSELKTLVNNNLRFQTIGRVAQLEPVLQKQLAAAVESCSSCTGTLVQVALNYSGRQELADVMRRLCEAAVRGEAAPDAVDEAWVSAQLDTAGQPDPDLLIRTSGERRISNFMLWQLAYAEIYFSSVLWPDFGKADLLDAVLDYQQRERRFGGLAPDERGLFTPTGDPRAGS